MCLESKPDPFTSVNSLSNQYKIYLTIGIIFFLTIGTTFLVQLTTEI